VDKAALDELCINTIRFLAVDAVQKANSGHPGAPMGAAVIAYTLWQHFLKHDPEDPKWPDRDRFILSAGHASALLYALLHLTGYDLSLEDIKNFRQWGSKTPGHPECGVTPGVEVTTGPLGQGFANGVGLAMAERHLAARYNKPGREVISHYTYSIVSDGDLMEGISAEAASLAGHLKLGKLIYLYDDNDISIEGSTDLTFTEDVARRFLAHGWQVIGPVDGMDSDTIAAAIIEAQKETEKPSLIICKTIIGYGSPNKQGTAATHGEPLGAEEVVLTKKNLGWPYPEKTFYVPPEAAAHFGQAIEKGKKRQQEWQQKLKAYQSDYPDEGERLRMELAGELPDGWNERLNELFKDQDKPMATRQASGMVLNAIADKVPALMGGSADLGPSNLTTIKDEPDFQPGSYRGSNIHFGVREHAMGAIALGLAVHGGVIPYTGSFLIFYDYMRPPVRLAALTELRVIYIFTHDSIGLGEDGPTHQSVEQMAGLRSVPHLVAIRPASSAETAVAWQVALERSNGPTALCLTRQKLPPLNEPELASAENLRRGGYILWQADDNPDVVLIATGSEVWITLDAAKELKGRAISARVVSLPSWELFDQQPQQYKDSILPPDIKARISIEAASCLGWERYVGLDGKIIGLDRFGASAPGNVVMEKLGFTSQHIIKEVLELLKGGKR
jgi:transketolase